MRNLFAFSGPDFERLGEVELKTVAVRTKDLLGDFQNDRVLNEGGGMAGPLQQAAKALGVRPVEITLAERRLLEARTEIVVQRAG
jgi:hypothetical protein